MRETEKSGKHRRRVHPISRQHVLEFYLKKRTLFCKTLICMPLICRTTSLAILMEARAMGKRGGPSNNSLALDGGF